LITGVAGFLGSHLADRLLARGHSVIGYDNLITGRLVNLAHLAGHPHFHFVQQDVTEHLFVPGPVDYVWHFASPASPIDYLELPIQTLKVGSLGTLNALGLAKAKNARFLLTSTSEIYGDPHVHPQPESYWGNVNTIGPRGCYDESKRFAELAPGVPLQVETISGFAKPMNWKKDEFWVPFPNYRDTAAFKGWVEFTKKGKAIPSFKAPEGPGKKDAEIAYQKGELERSTQWLRQHTA